MKTVRLTQAELAMMPFGFEEVSIRRKLHEAGIDITKDFSKSFDMRTGDEVFTQKEEGD